MIWRKTLRKLNEKEVKSVSGGYGKTDQVPSRPRLFAIIKPGQTYEEALEATYVGGGLQKK